jgi:hypothetical protein
VSSNYNIRYSKAQFAPTSVLVLCSAERALAFMVTAWIRTLSSGCPTREEQDCTHSLPTATNAITLHSPLSSVFSQRCTTVRAPEMPDVSYVLSMWMRNAWRRLPRLFPAWHSSTNAQIIPCHDSDGQGLWSLAAWVCHLTCEVWAPYWSTPCLSFSNSKMGMPMKVPT